MRLERLLKRLNNSVRLKDYPLDLDIKSISANSKTLRKGSLFVAVEGTKSRGSDFIAEALRNGALCVVGSRLNAEVGQTSSPRRVNFKQVPFIKVKDSRRALAVLADEFFDHPSKKLKVIGVTGTNGKTTITYLIRDILKQADFSSGIIGTINYCYQDKVIPAPHTTPGPIELQSLLNDMAKSACQYCVMEVSSHGLDQERTAGIDFESAIFTNLTPDHLDYHKTLENYFLAKSRLFGALKTEARAIVNLDSPYAGRLRSLSRGRFVGYAIDSPADFKARDLNLSLEGSEFVLETQGIKSRIKTRLTGRHNILNILAAIAFGVTQKIELSRIQKAMENFEGVRGRLCRVKANTKNVFIDYAHTPDALENVLSVLRQFTKGRLCVVFGCGGERDRLKRPLMGAVVEKYADVIIITSDNPRGEEPLAIAQEIAAGIKTKEYKIILDRREAIERALAKFSSPDTVLIAGKGHENYQVFKDKKIEFDDQIVVEGYIREKGL